MTAAEILDKIQGARVAVVGDPMVDVYHFGRVERICPEAPVPVFIPERHEERPGGAANVANQLNALGCTVIECFPRERSRKTRYMAGSHLMLRVDRDATRLPTPEEVERVVSKLADAAALEAVVLSDYARGWLNYHMCQRVIDVAVCREAPVIVDPKGTDWAKYYGAELVCPSRDDGEPEGPIYVANVLKKRGAEGMFLCQDADEYGHFRQITHIPTTARHVYDVTGAGDTVVAVVAAARAVGASLPEATRLAALAAGYVVGEVGTTVIGRGKLKELVDAART